jgi:methionyl aminopeptidase
MIVSSDKDIEGLKEIGRIVALTIKEMREAVRPGMTTKELDELGGEILRRHGAKSAPMVTYNFPGYTCISLNEEAAHGIPGDRVIQEGDVVNIDVSAEKNGYYADSGQSFQVPPHNPEITRLCEYTEQTMMKVIQKLRHGMRLNEIGRMFEQEAAKGGYKVVRNLCSHGIGRGLHEYPKEIEPVYNKHDKRLLKEGLVITVEPFLTTGPDYVIGMPDGWTLVLPERGYVAQYEHTIIITKGEPIITTVV